MNRRIAILLLPPLALALACLGGAWLALRPPIAQYVVPGASDVRVRDVAVGERYVTYDAPGDHYAWYFSVASELERSGWIPPDKWGPRDQLNTYRRVRPVWGGYGGYIWEQVELRGEPSRAQITLRRWFTFPWRRYLDYFR